MSNFISSIGMPEVAAAVIVLALNAYVLTGGADYGGGVWDLLATGPRREQQRELIATSIAPIWEANHVWLIVVVVMMFTGFPAAFAMLGIVLHIPITVMLLGIVLRGSAFVFRSYGTQTKTSRQAWGRTFAIASTITPLVLGDIVGTVTSGSAGVAAANMVRSSFVAVFVSPWLSPFPAAVGVFALALFAFLAAVYLARSATSAELQEDFRRRALASAGAVFVAAAMALALFSRAAPDMMKGLLFSSWGVVLQAATGACAMTAIVALWTRRFTLARFAAGAQVSCILWGWALSQYPYVVPPSLSIRAAAAPRETLILLLAGLTGGAAILIPSLRYLFRTFAGRRSLVA